MKNRWNKHKKALILLGLAGVIALLPSNAYGQEKPEETGLSSMYGIGSTSKVIVTAAVMKLVEEGDIDLDQPLISYIPEFQMADDRYKKITPRMLLDHTSGLQGSTLTNAMLLGDSDTDNHDHLLDRLKNQRLKAEPGAFGTYCNDGFTLAEILVEQVSGLTFTDYIEQEMAAPLGLSWVKTPQSPSVQKDLAPIYDELSGEELPPEAANVIGSGGIYATAEDLVRLAGIFTRDQAGAKGIISPETAEKMEYSSYAEQWNPMNRDSNLTYGLGWDSVDSYPFNQYGIKALVKGGDTNYYHASLTVLPEENIACAVLSSGGSSNFDQLAVQEILLEYLNEIDRIDRDEESEGRWLDSDNTAEGKEQISGDQNPIEGWYTGAGLLEVSTTEPRIVDVKTREKEYVRTQRYKSTDGGRFVSTEGNYINGAGIFSKGSNGRIGKTYLEWLTDPQGKNYLMANIYERYPGLGITAAYMPMGELVKEQNQNLSEETLNSWKEYDGKNFYQVSDKYTSTAYVTRFRVKPRITEELAGYLTFDDNELNMAQLSDSLTSKFFQQVPGQAGRDLSDYRIEKRNGSTYLTSSSSEYIEESDIEPLTETMKSVVIEQEGEAVWYHLGSQLPNRPVSITAPSDGAWYIYDETGREARFISASWTVKEGQSLILPKEGKIVFAGNKGSAFTIEFKQQEGQME